MSESNRQVRIRLTQEQQAMVREATGKDAEAIELSTQELEERIAPTTFSPILITKPTTTSSP